MLTFEDYAEATARTAVYPQKYRAAYPLLGLLGEAGELLDAVIDKACADPGFSRALDTETHPLVRDLRAASDALRRIEQWKKLARKDTIDAEGGLHLGTLSAAMVGDTGWTPEMGDVLWYADRIAADAKTSLAAIANDNTEKLRKRAVDGTLKDRGGVADEGSHGG